MATKHTRLLLFARLLTFISAVWLVLQIVNAFFYKSIPVVIRWAILGFPLVVAIGFALSSAMTILLRVAALKNIDSAYGEMKEVIYALFNFFLFLANGACKNATERKRLQ